MCLNVGNWRKHEDKASVNPPGARPAGLLPRLPLVHARGGLLCGVLLPLDQRRAKGFVRMDYIVSDEGVFFIEANIVPGMSEASIIPAQARCYGLTLEQLFGMAIENAMKR